MRRESYVFVCLLAIGCSAPGDGRLPSPKRGLVEARKSTLEGTPAERAAAHRRVIELCLDEGWSDEAALDYLALRELAGEDEALLESVAWGTLRSAIRAPDPARRLRATQALARVIPNQRASALLASGLDDPHAEVQVACVHALSRAGWATIHTTLEACESRSEPAARRAALQVAAREVRAGLVEPEQLGRVLPALRLALERGPDSVRLAGLELLDALGPLDGVEDLLARSIAQANEDVSQRAAVILAAHDPARATEVWSQTHLSTSAELDAFARALGTHGGGPLPAVERDLASNDPRILQATLRGLRGPGAARLSASVHALIEAPSRAVRLAALDLSRRWAPLPEPALRQLWAHPDPATRVAAFSAAAQGGPLDLATVEPLWESGDRALAPLVAAHLLSEGQRGLELLAEGVSRPATSRSALNALRGRPEAHGRFQGLLTAHDPATRRLAAGGLVSTADRNDVFPLLEGLTTLRADTDVLCAAALLSAIESPASPSVE